MAAVENSVSVHVHISGYNRLSKNDYWREKIVVEDDA